MIWLVLLLAQNPAPTPPVVLSCTVTCTAPAQPTPSTSPTPTATPTPTPAPPSVLITWNASTTPNVGVYRVYRATVSGAEFPNGWIGNAGCCTFTDPQNDTAGTPPLVAGTSDFYQVVSVDSAGNSSVPSAEASVTIPASGQIPMNLGAVPKSP